MPPRSTLLSVFRPTLTHAILESKWRDKNSTCLCDLALHHIQKAMPSINIKTNCPENVRCLLLTFAFAFTNTVTQDMFEELLDPTQHRACTLEEIDARVASETWERHFRPHLAQVLCIGMVNDAYENAEKEAIGEAEQESVGAWSRFKDRMRRVAHDWRVKFRKGSLLVTILVQAIIELQM